MESSSERRARRPSNPIYSIPHWHTQGRMGSDAEKLSEIMQLITKYFGNLGGFLRSFTDNKGTSHARSYFLNVGLQAISRLNGGGCTERGRENRERTDFAMAKNSLERLDLLLNKNSIERRHCCVHFLALLSFAAFSQFPYSGFL